MCLRMRERVSEKERACVIERESVCYRKRERVSKKERACVKERESVCQREMEVLFGAYSRAAVEEKRLQRLTAL